MATNREKLNQMTNEELAEFLNKTANDNCSICIYSNLPDCFCRDCQDGILQWLNKESEE